MQNYMFDCAVTVNLHNKINSYFDHDKDKQNRSHTCQLSDFVARPIETFKVIWRQLLRLATIKYGNFPLSRIVLIIFT